MLYREMDPRCRRRKAVETRKKPVVDVDAGMWASMDELRHGCTARLACHPCEEHYSLVRVQNTNIIDSTTGRRL